MKVLIFCIHFRKKYLSAIGSESDIFSKFDLVIDIKKICKPDHGDVAYSDLIKNEKVVSPGSIDEFRRILENKDIELSLIFNPQSYKNMKIIYNLVENNSKKWGIIRNKGTLRTLSFKVFLYYMYCALSRLINKGKIIHNADFLFTNFKLFYKIDGLKFISFKKVLAVRHFDAVPVRDNSINENGRYGLFLDQYFPFHSANVEKKKIRIDPEKYYSELENYLDIIKTRYDLDYVVISRHPNSNGEELEFIKKHKTDIGHSAQLTYGAELVMTHYSDSISFAIQLGKPFVNVNLPGVLPEIMTSHILKAVKKLSSEYHVYDGNLKIINNNRIKRYWLKKIYKLFFNPDAPLVVDYIDDL